MNTTLVAALIVPWVFWGMLIAAGRSWINLLLFPACITVLILIVVSLSSVRNAFWTSLMLHLFLFVFFLGSYLCFMLGERKKKGKQDRRAGEKRGGRKKAKKGDTHKSLSDWQAYARAIPGRKNHGSG